MYRHQHTGAPLAVHFKEEMNFFQLTDSRLLWIKTDDISLNYSLTRKLQSTIEISRIACHAFRNHIPCMAYVIQLAYCAFMSTLGVKHRTKCWEAQQRNQLFRENKCIEMWKSQWLWNVANARINKLSAMKPGLEQIMEKLCISRYVERPGTDLPVTTYGGCIDYSDTKWWQRALSLPEIHSENFSNTKDGSKVMVELDGEVDWLSVPNRRIYLRVAQVGKIHSLHPAPHNWGCIVRD